MRIKLVEDWRKAHRWLSTQLCIVAASVSLAYEYLPAAREFIAPYVSPHVMAGIAALVIVARVIDQGGKKP